ncbi:MAG: immunoglobulin domain-containing protein, partial [Phycisphaerales bacterium]
VASSTWQTFAPGVQGGNGVAKVVRLSTSPDLFLFGSFLKLGDAAPSTPAAFIARVASGGTSPVITAQPVNRTVCPGPVSFVVTATGTPAPTYRWRRNGVPMNIATNPSAATSTLAFSNAGESDNGNYDCVVTNACGSVTSQVGRLTVCRADYDCSGGVDSDDVIEFFGDWDVSNSSADFNGDGGVDADDVIGFFARWDGGC